MRRFTLGRLMAVIVFLAVYPQLVLHRSERSVQRAVAATQLLTTCGPHHPCAYFSAHAGRTAGLEPLSGTSR